MREVLCQRCETFELQVFVALYQFENKRNKFPILFIEAYRQLISSEKPFQMEKMAIRWQNLLHTRRPLSSEIFSAPNCSTT